MSNIELKKDNELDCSFVKFNNVNLKLFNIVPDASFKFISLKIAKLQFKFVSFINSILFIK